MLQAKARVKGLPVAQFKTIAGPSLPSHANPSPFSQVGSPKATHFLAQMAQNIPLSSGAYRFPSSFSLPLPSPSQIPSRKGQWLRVCWQPWQQGCDVFFHKASTSGHWEVFERDALLSAAPSPDTPAISWLLCRWLLRPSSPRFDASATGTPELESSAWKTSSKSSPHPSSHHQAMPRFSELH